MIYSHQFFSDSARIRHQTVRAVKSVCVVEESMLKYPLLYSLPKYKMDRAIWRLKIGSSLEPGCWRLELLLPHDPIIRRIIRRRDQEAVRCDGGGRRYPVARRQIRVHLQRVRRDAPGPAYQHVGVLRRNRRDN